MCRNNRYLIDLTPGMISSFDGTVRTHEGDEDYIPLELMYFPIPSYVNLDNITNNYEDRKVLCLLDSRDLLYTLCPNCKCAIPHPTLVIVLDDLHILPCLICNNMVWVDNNKYLKVRFEKYHEVTT